MKKITKITLLIIILSIILNICISLILKNRIYAINQTISNQIESINTSKYYILD